MMSTLCEKTFFAAKIIYSTVAFLCTRKEPPRSTVYLSYASTALAILWTAADDVVIKTNKQTNWIKSSPRKGCAHY